MGITKKSLIYLSLELVAIFLWLFFIGQATGISGVSSDINMIDEGQFAAWISHMLHGKMMYKDFYLPYGPLQIYPLYLLVKLLGVNMFLIRFDMTVVGVFLGLCVALFLLKELKIQPLIRAITTVFLILLPGVHIRYWIVALFILLILEAFKKKSRLLALISGILLAVTLLESINVGIFAVIIFTGYISFLFVRSKNIKRDVGILGKFIFGFAFPLVIFSLFAIREGWLKDYIGAMTEVLTSASGINLANGQGLPDIFSGGQPTLSPLHVLQFAFSKSMLFYWSLLLMLLFLTIIVIRFFLRKTTKEDGIIFLVLCFGFLIYTSIIGRSGHYFLLVPFVLISGGYFLSLVFQSNRMKDTTSKILNVLVLSLFLLYGIRHLMIFRHTQFFNPLVVQSANLTVPRVTPLTISKGQAQDILMLQDFFSKNTKSTDTIFIFNNLPALYFLLDRENPTYYDLPFLAYSREKRMEIISQLKRSSPKFIIEDKDSWAVDGVSDRQRLPEVITYIQTQYQKKTQLGHFILYQKTYSAQ